MPYLLVFLIAAAAGSGVAVATLRRGEVSAAKPETWTKGYEGSEEVATEPEVVEPGHRKPLPSAPTWQTRLTGIVGLLIAVLLGAGVIVGACFALWSALRRVFTG